jgi:hypothetical protein
VAEEVADMRAIAGHDIEPWDYLYFAEKVRKAKYDLDQNELKPYFELNASARLLLHGRAPVRLHSSKSCPPGPCRSSIRTS